MALVELIMPKMGESIMEATILKWLKGIGDRVEMDESVLEIATDKVDSDVPSPVEGILKEILFEEGDTVEVGKAIAIIASEGEEDAPSGDSAGVKAVETVEQAAVAVEETVAVAQTTLASKPAVSNGNGARFYSPLVLNIARQENIGMAELEALPGSGKGGRVTKKDILAYVKSRTQPTQKTVVVKPGVSQPKVAAKAPVAPPVDKSGNVEIVEMDRMRKLIADHMVMSKSVSPHVTSFVEADVTEIVNWRNGIKADFQKREGEKITFTPIFIEAVAQALKEFPGVNASVDGNNIIYRKDINVGIATALPSGNLIVPVIKHADRQNLLGLTKSLNEMVQRARSNKLKPEDIQGGTFTLTNVGTFGNVMGTPIINQPQVAILATGAIRKKPAVVETKYGDVIAIRHMMFLSHSYDHRIVDGAMGGSFLRRVADLLEGFDPNRTI